ncbi:DsrE family protein [Flagellimonas okinawensis]|uniref:DsrE family protein n=1 Tax=Flagellimonas okinawensis TaxID=3031324 RepID=A0ABT5XKW3_9FLAO|nr:DsrE family protein [[Muricauda] okinawensis]MDF0706529.1 DsrE family protein [[Muricauda] okinawensis]
MKILRAFFFLGIIMLCTTNKVTAQDKFDAEIVSVLQKTKQYAFGVSEERHFRGVLSLYDKLVASGVEISDYEIVAKGKFVKNLVKDSELEVLYQKYKGKVRVSVCSVAMGKLGVSEDQLIPGMEPVATWTVRVLQLQAKGYNTLTY